ncbi:MAG: hypothetical protein OEM91_13980 [Hyphomicrobiales bacterium]|nr:hypothetical protein [Hyphomicrobiales bacterium]
MAKKTNLRTEVDTLRGELAELREGRASPEEISVETAAVDDSNAREDLDDSATLPGPAEIEQAISEFVQSTKKELEERPAMVVALAFLLGIVIGRFSR